MASLKTSLFIVFCFVFLHCMGGHVRAAQDMATQCAADTQKVVACLNFASGKASTPGKECCDSVTSIREKTPQCLCFFIAQAHNGSQQLKSMGVQEAKLLQLPSACNLKNATVSDCPKLLGISPNSPQAAIFSNSSSASTATSSGTTKQSPTMNAASSDGSKIETHITVFTIVASFLFA